METAILHGTEPRHRSEQQYTPLSQEQRTHVDTATAAHHLGLRPQTLRGHHCHGCYVDDALRPISINGRLRWPVSGLRKVLIGVPF